MQISCQPQRLIRSSSRTALWAINWAPLLIVEFLKMNDSVMKNKPGLRWNSHECVDANGKCFLNIDHTAVRAITMKPETYQVCRSNQCLHPNDCENKSSRMLPCWNYFQEMRKCSWTTVMWKTQIPVFVFPIPMQKGNEPNEAWTRHIFLSIKN